MTLEELRAKRTRVATELRQQQDLYNAGKVTDGMANRIRNLDRSLANTDSEIRDLEVRQEAVLRAAANEDNLESGWESPSAQNSPRDHRSSERDEALRSINHHSDVLDAAAGDRLELIVRSDRAGHDARYLRAVANPAYETAFLKRMLLRDGERGAITPDEGMALEAVGEAMVDRALSIGAPSAGGYALPFTLDPTIMNTSDGSINPLRSLATVTPITTNTWKGVSSAGVTASFSAEATEVGDNSPSLAQPSIDAEKAQAFVPFSIKLSQDWGSILHDLAELLADGRDQLEAVKFLAGAGPGSNEPTGLITGLDSGSVIATTTALAIGTGDIYKLQEALPPRFQPNGSWIGSNIIANHIYQLTGPGSDEPSLFNENRDRILGKPFGEVSHMDAALTANKKILGYGDIAKAYRIVDRIGMTVEMVPHLMGENGRPTGQRGLYAYWRVGADVINDNAVRLLNVKAS